MARLPVLVKVIAVLTIVGGALHFLFAIALFFLPKGTARPLFFESFFRGLGDAMIPFTAGMLILLGAVLVIIGLGLWRAKKLARRVTIIGCILAMLVSLVSLQKILVLSIIQIIVNAGIGAYLLFSKQVKKAFG
jgi:hypothetical protein